MHKSTKKNAPRNIAEVIEAFEKSDIMQQYGRSLAGDVFYIGAKVTDTYGFVVFASMEIVKDMPEMSEKRICVDGTFGVVPFGDFDQLLVFHVEFQEHVSYYIFC